MEEWPSMSKGRFFRSAGFGGRLANMTTAQRVLACAAFLVFAAASSFLLDACSAPSASASADASSEVSTSPIVREPAAGSEQAGFPVTITDLDGTEVTIDSADRIVSLVPSCTSILEAEGAAARIVGTDSDSMEIQGAELCGSYAAPDLEKVTALNPDVVFAAGKLQADAVSRMRDLGLTVVCAEATKWEQVPLSFELIGRAAGETENAADLVAQLQDAEKQAEQQQPAEKPSCYYVLSYGDAGNWSSGPDTFINTMMEMAGGVCVTEDAPVAWPEYTTEQVVAFNPDCIILASSAGSYEDFIRSPGYADLNAVKSGRVYEIDADTVSQPGPNLAEAVLSMSAIMNTAAEDLVAAAAPDAA